MVSASTVTIVYTLLSLAVAGAWITGYLDGLQKQAQNALLGTMGDNRASYGLKSTIKTQQVIDDKNFKTLQDGVADTAGDLVGKRGIAGDIGDGLSKAL